MKYVIAMLACLAAPLPALADEVPAETVAEMGEMLDACWQDETCAPDGALNFCGEAINAGGSPNAWAFCQQVVYEWWDAKLNATYQARMTQQEAYDADQDGTPYQDALRDMQRAWIPFRDTACEFAARGQPGGSGAITDHMECLIQMTITQLQFIDRPLTCLMDPALCTTPHEIRF
ncbi:lysozyme inhibitor LprI family protein [Dinoroseobacter sp. S124A]|uniref:lysozyme inhibitor LprI family protein n=1 Tax=Dinoroseobacter sp. S124A TaxID=3415128 RepID=UPI003C7A756C